MTVIKWHWCVFSKMYHFALGVIYDADLEYMDIELLIGTLHISWYE